MHPQNRCPKNVAKKYVAKKILKRFVFPHIKSANAKLLNKKLEELLKEVNKGKEDADKVKDADWVELASARAKKHHGEEWTRAKKFDKWKAWKSILAYSTLVIIYFHLVHFGALLHRITLIIYTE